MIPIRQRKYGRTAAGNRSEGAQAPLPIQQHRYKLGQEVRYLLGPIERLSRQVEKTMVDVTFEISRLLPASGMGFQYRIKNTATGHERVVNETDIVATAALDGGSL